MQRAEIKGVTTLHPKLNQIQPFGKRDRSRIFKEKSKQISKLIIMFAATQQIASVAGLKATKVQVRSPCSLRSVSLSLSLSVCVFSF